MRNSANEQVLRGREHVYKKLTGLTRWVVMLQYAHGREREGLAMRPFCWIAFTALLCFATCASADTVTIVPTDPGIGSMNGVYVGAYNAMVSGDSTQIISDDFADEKFSNLLPYSSSVVAVSSSSSVVSVSSSFSVSTLNLGPSNGCGADADPCPVPEGGTVWYVLIGGAACFGATLLGSRRQRSRRAVAFIPR
jgi:hypothetical protein